MNITLCTKTDYDTIITALDDFWDSSNIENLRRQHNPVFLYEFGNTAFVAKEGETVAGYLFGLYSQTELAAYIKFVGVRASFRQRGVGRALYEYFTKRANSDGYHRFKAITMAKNNGSIAFHTKMGFALLGEPDENGVPVVRDYAGPGMDRVVFVKGY